MAKGKAKFKRGEVVCKVKPFPYPRLVAITRIFKNGLLSLSDGTARWQHEVRPLTKRERGGK